MYKFCFPAIFILLLSVSCFSQSSPQIFTTKEGDQFQIELKPEKEEVMLGEPTFLLLEVKNFSDLNLNMRITSSVINDELVPASRMTIVDFDGKPVSQRNSNMRASAVEFENSTTTSAKSSSTRKLYLSNWANFRDSGIYTINLTITFYAVRNSVRYSTLFQADFTSSITYVQPDYNKMGEVIDSLGKTLLDENSLDGSVKISAVDALKKLGNLDDERVIPYLVQALNISASLLKVPTKEELKNIKFWAVKRDSYSNAAEMLVKFDNYDAIKAIENAMNSENDSVRNNVTNCLFRSKNPQSENILIRFRNHNDASIRFTAVRILERNNTEESNKLLREMVNDKSDRVRNEVQQILTRRAQK